MNGVPAEILHSRAPITTFDRGGPAACSDDQLLALVLGGSPADLTLARRLLDDLGGVAGLAPDELAAWCRQPGVGLSAGAALAAAVELGRRAASSWPEPAWRIGSPADVADRLMPVMGHLEREQLRGLVLNSKNVVTGMTTVYEGNLAGSPVRVGEIFRDAVRRQAAALVVVHNHPSGDPAPSAEDLRITADLAQAGRLLDIELLDHVVIGAGRWVSLRATGSL